MKHLFTNFRFLLGLCLLLSVVSCIPNRKVVYLQQKNPLPGDTLAYARQEAYRLQPGDLLQITVRSFNEKATAVFNPTGGSSAGSSGESDLYFAGYQVDSKGSIELPVIGKLQVVGKTVEEIKTMLDEATNRYFKDATVSVKFSGINYSIVGEVNNPGRYILYQDRLNIMDAIANAGDLSLLANRSRVEVFRHYPDQARHFTVDLTDVNLIRSPHYFIKPNDIIVVAPLKAKAAGTGSTGLSTFQAILSVLTTAALIITIFNR